MFGTLALGLSLDAGAAPALRPAAPAITVVEPVTNPAAFDIDLPSGNGNHLDADVGDTLRVQITLATDTGFAAVEEDVPHVLDGDDLASNPIEVAGLDTLDADDYIARARLERPDVGVSAWSETSASFEVPAPPPSAVTLGTTTHHENTNDLSTYTFAGVTLPAGTLLIGIAYRAASLQNVTALTVDGAAAAHQVTGATASNVVAWYSVTRGSSGTGDVVVTLDGAVLRMGLAIVPLTGAGASPTDTGTSGVDPGSDTLTVPDGGVGVGITMSSGGTSYTWTGITEVFDTTIEGAVVYSVAAAEFETGGATAMSATAASAGTAPATAFITWGP